MSLMDFIDEQWAPSPQRLILIAVVNLPVIVILLNALRQIVRFPLVNFTQLILQKLIPRDPSLPPQVFHWLPFIGSAIQYGNDPINFFFRCREKVCSPSSPFSSIYPPPFSLPFPLSGDLRSAHNYYPDGSRSNSGDNLPLPRIPYTVRLPSRSGRQIYPRPPVF